MKPINLSSLPTLTGKSERTLWRWIAEGTLVRAQDTATQGKTTVQFESVIPYLSIVIDPGDYYLIEDADAGNAEAQNDLAMIFMDQNKPESAKYWLELGANQNYSESMHWLGRCYIDGRGVSQDENLGIMWLARAASHGHVISQSQIQAMRDSFMENR